MAEQEPEAAADKRIVPQVVSSKNRSIFKKARARGERRIFFQKRAEVGQNIYFWYRTAVPRTRARDTTPPAVGNHS